MRKNSSHHKTIPEYLFVVIFLMGIFMPLIVGVLAKDLKISNIEKRSLSAFPASPITLEKFESFPSGFTNYYADHFGFRDWLLGRYHRLKYNIGDSPSDKVIIGKDKWMFLGSIRNKAYSDPIGDARNVNQYTDIELEQFATNISALNAHLRTQNIEYIFVIVPNKHTIYFEHLPSYIIKENPLSAMDQLVSYLQSNTDVNILDLRPSLFEAKNTSEELLYFKTDTHWNHRGSNIGQYEIMKKIALLFPNSLIPELKELRTETISANDLARFIGISDLSEKAFYPIFDNDCEAIRTPKIIERRQNHVWTCTNQKLSSLIFGDSFFINLSPYFARKFLRTNVLFSPINPELLNANIGNNKPDIIIEEWVERSLPRAYTDAFLGMTSHQPEQ